MVRSMRLKAGAWVVAMGIALSGCVTAPPPPPTIAEVTVSAGVDTNPDANGRPSPVVVRVYELTGPLTFSQADFMQLFTKDSAVLGAELRSRAEIPLAPGQSKALRIEMKPDSKGIGVIALFRDYLNANWRGYAEIPPNQTTTVQAEIGARHVVIKSAAK